MNLLARMKEKEDHIWALGFSVLLCVVIGIFFDYYYSLNDDVLMKDILAGVYTGTPEGRNIQMLFPISWFISLFYRVARPIPWYGLFLCLCHFGSIYLVTVRILSFSTGRLKKILLMVLEAGFVTLLLLKELVFIQYTVTCTLLAAVAAFLFYTAEPAESVRDFVKNNLVSIVLVILAFQIRSEMLLLVLPLICVTGLCKWACEKPFFTKQNAAKYLSVFGGIMVGLFLSQGIHIVAHGSEDWQRFNVYFNNRTELYDFLWEWFPSYEGNEGFYESIELSENGRMLLQKYNFGLDEEIDEEVLGKISNYADELRRASTSFRGTLKKAVLNYRYRLFNETDSPWNLIVIAMYVLVFIAALLNKRFRFIWELLCLVMVRTGLWMYILYRNRVPERITHSLYLMEFMILLAFLLVECKREDGLFSVCRVVFAGVLSVLCLINIRTSVAEVHTEYTRRESIYQEFLAIQDYTKTNEGNFYFVDVYSSISYSEKLFQDVDNTTANYDLMGGWASKSPLTKKKFRYFGISAMDEALLRQENVYVLDKSGELSWLINYYAEKGVAVNVEKTDCILFNGREIFGVYAVSETSK